MGRKYDLSMTRVKDKSREAPDSTLLQDHTSSIYFFATKNIRTLSDFDDVQRVQPVWRVLTRASRFQIPVPSGLCVFYYYYFFMANQEKKTRGCAPKDGTTATIQSTDS